MMSVTGPAEGEPIRVGVAIGDLLAGMYACNAITAALFAKERRKTWQRIDISLLDALVGSMSYVASNYLVSGAKPRRFGNAHPNIVPYQSFAASDGHLAFAAGNDLQWGKFCKAIGKDGWALDERFSTNPARVKNRIELIGLLDALFTTRTVAEWLAICEKAGIPAASIKTIDEVLADPQVRAREMVESIEIQGETINLLGSPLKIPTSPVALRYPPPSLGQHTEEILRKVLKYPKKKISTLRNEKVI
jgi:crotonobetainyl-CoA:carnitine CoA-transferase CaiB-like acyl-CoA transferase